MFAAVCDGEKDPRVEPVDERSLAAGEVRVAVAYGGIGDSDLHYYHRGAVGDFAPRDPVTLGHEVPGTVLEVGDGVGRLEPDPKAALDPSRPCLLVRTFPAHDEFRLAVECILAGRIDVTPILSGTYPLSQAATALERAGDRSRVVKLHLALADHPT